MDCVKSITDVSAYPPPIPTHTNLEFEFLTNNPMEVRLMLSSWFCKPKLPATSTTIWRQVQGMVGRKSVTTSCRHWKAVRIRDSLKGTTSRHFSQRGYTVTFVIVGIYT